ncbi:pantothenate kinase [Metapseudomonas otitidis]|uniref:pantothenate kinase n=1 Tax=Metapseudomonas otitidis TaxID=319939 RepID=UPI0013F68EE5|nr:pantothenate kinase [Pseudomonas otitidis]
MILELDCGNSFIKWRVIGADDGVSRISGVAPDSAALIGAINEFDCARIQRCRLVSVRSEEETSSLLLALEQALHTKPLLASPSKMLAGVGNGYQDFQKLGLDRWLAVLGAYHTSKKASLVLDLGTAVTADFVTSGGEHLGGYICPGVPLMRSQLRTHTRRIRYDDETAARAIEDMRPGRSTAEAVERGCLLMLKGFVRMQLDLAHQQLGDDIAVFLTGGDAALVKEDIPSARLAPDLVFSGLAIACPLD